VGLLIFCLRWQDDFELDFFVKKRYKKNKYINKFVSILRAKKAQKKEVSRT